MCLGSVRDGFYIGANDVCWSDTLNVLDAFAFEYLKCKIEVHVLDEQGFGTTNWYLLVHQDASLQEVNEMLLGKYKLLSVSIKF